MSSVPSLISLSGPALPSSYPYIFTYFYQQAPKHLPSAPNPIPLAWKEPGREVSVPWGPGGVRSLLGDGQQAGTPREVWLLTLISEKPLKQEEESIIFPQL